MSEKDKIDSAVFSDFISELEMLNKRLFELEKLEQSRKNNKQRDPQKLKKEQDDQVMKKHLLTKLSNIQKSLSDLSTGRGSIINLHNLMVQLTSSFFKEQKIEENVEKFTGFVEYFEDKWDEVVDKINEHNSFISKPNSDLICVFIYFEC